MKSQDEQHNNNNIHILITMNTPSNSTENSLASDPQIIINNRPISPNSDSPLQDRINELSRTIRTKLRHKNYQISNLHKTLRVTKSSYHTQLRNAHIRGDTLQAQLRNLDTSKNEQIKRLTTTQIKERNDHKRCEEQKDIIINQLKTETRSKEQTINNLKSIISELKDTISSQTTSVEIVKEKHRHREKMSITLETQGEHNRHEEKMTELEIKRKEIEFELEKMKTKYRSINQTQSNEETEPMSHNECGTNCIFKCQTNLRAIIIRAINTEMRKPQNIC